MENSDGNDNDEDKNLIPGRIPLDQVRKQVKELKDAVQVFEETNPKSKRIFNAISMYSVAMEFAFIIAFPLIAFVLIGRWADARYGTKYIVVIGIFLGLSTSVVGITKQIKKLSAQMKNKK